MTMFGLSSESLYKVTEAIYLWIQKIDNDGDIFGSMLFSLDGSIEPNKIFLNLYSNKDRKQFSEIYGSIELVEINEKLMFKYLFEDMENEIFNFYLDKLKQGLKKKWR